MNEHVRDRSDLLAVMNSIIQENSSNEERWNPDLSSLQKAIGNVGDSTSKNFLAYLRTHTLKRWEERIEKLEEVNEKLLCVVHFLFEKVFGITKNLLDPVQSQSENLKCERHETATENVTRNCTQKPKPSLTKREVDIFNLLAKGLCAKEIAKTLFISETTVITHKKNLKKKFKAKNTVELISNVLARREL